jgi:leucyl aminopeptidase
MLCKIALTKTFNFQGTYCLLLIIKDKQDFDKLIEFPLSNDERTYILDQFDKKHYLFPLSGQHTTRFIQILPDKDKKYHYQLEETRIAGSKLQKETRKYKIHKITLVAPGNDKFLIPFVEGFLLADYKFLKYKREKEESDLKEITLSSNNIKKNELGYLNTVIEANYIARDLVNEPASFLTAVEFSRQIRKLCDSAGLYQEVFEKNKIKALKMGGMMAVNRGSQNPPTFNIIEWKPENRINKRPIVLVGKGLTFDTGGLSLKPTLNSMDEMKSDMAGGAVVVAVLWALAKLKCKIWVVGLVPATDNRPGENAYLPGDIIYMYDGTSVEVLNTDAEGRLILADALAYAKKYNPELVIDIATLTGSAAMAIGKYGLVGFTNMNESFDKDLLDSGNSTYERIVPFPLWEEYGDLIKSDIADIKNVGGKEAGAITAAKFLEKFTDYNWIHLDIAGPAFNAMDHNYYPKGGSGYGVRLLIDYLINKTIK